MFDDDNDDDYTWGIPLGICLALVLWIVGNACGVLPW